MPSDQGLEGVLIQPTYAMLDADFRMVIRRFNSEQTHIAEAGILLTDAAVILKWIGPSYWGFQHPTKTVCGSTLKPDHRGVIIMQPGTKVKCTMCVRFENPTSVSGQGENVEL